MDRRTLAVARTAELAPEWTVNDAIAHFPATIAVFNRLGIDACCGGSATIAEAAIRDGVDPVVLLAALRDVTDVAAHP
jgi:regulator of cell morphogenesis and NO signaling